MKMISGKCAALAVAAAVAGGFVLGSMSPAEAATTTTRSYCLQCHTSDTEMISRHHMLNGQPVVSGSSALVPTDTVYACNTCHQSTIDPATGQSYVVVDRDCIQCHGAGTAFRKLTVENGIITATGSGFGKRPTFAEVMWHDPINYNPMDPTTACWVTPSVISWTDSVVKLADPTGCAAKPGATTFFRCRDLQKQTPVTTKRK